MLPYVNVPFEHLNQATGASIDELKLIACFLLSYPFAGILKRLPDGQPHVKNYFIIAVALFYLIGLFDLWSGIRTLLLSSAGAYAIAKYVTNPLMPWIGFTFLMGHMSISHIYRQIADDASVVDITGAQMVLVMKLTAFCWNIQDGRQPEEDLVDFQKERLIRQMPSLLDFAGYVLFFPSLFAGPAFDYIEFKRWLETTMFDLPPGIDPKKAPRTHKKRRIPRSGTPAAIKAAKGIGWILLFIQLSKYGSPDSVLNDSFLKYGFFRRILGLHMLGFTTRLKYYGVWTLTEGACILTGLGYRGINSKTGQVDWDRLQNVRPVGIELAQNSRAYLENWNINTNHWLRNYVYLRVTPRGKKPGFRASLATFITSAFWHGFYSGYYLTFILGAFIQTGAKNFRRYVRPLFLSPDGLTPGPYKRYYDVATYFSTQMVFCFTTAPFVLLKFSDSLLVWRRVYFYGAFMATFGIILFVTPLKSWLIQTQKMRLRTYEEQENIRESRKGAKRPSIKQIPSYVKGGMLGMPDDPSKDIDEILGELKPQVDSRSSSEAVSREKSQ